MVNKTVVCIFVRIPDGRRDRVTLPAADLYKSFLDSVQGVSEQRYERGTLVSCAAPQSMH